MNPRATQTMSLRGDRLKRKAKINPRIVVATNPRDIISAAKLNELDRSVLGSFPGKVELL